MGPGLSGLSVIEVMQREHQLEVKFPKQKKIQ